MSLELDILKEHKTVIIINNVNGIITPIYSAKMLVEFCNDNDFRSDYFCNDEHLFEVSLFEDWDEYIEDLTGYTED